MVAAKSTTDHDAIRRWAEARGGHPAQVDGDLRIGFGAAGDEISWDEWFRTFEDFRLEFVYEDGASRFNKLVERVSANGDG